MVAAVAARRLRVLGLHGYRTNRHVMLDQTRDLRQALGPNAELEFLDGPNEAGGLSDAIIETLYAPHKPFYEWWRQIGPDGTDIVDSESARKCLQPTADEGEWYMDYPDADRCIEYVDSAIRSRGPFDVLLGFSQGAILSTLLSLWYQQNQQPRPWALSICVGGMRVHGRNCRHLCESDHGEPYIVAGPSVHIMGKEDAVFKEGHKLVDMYAAGSGSPNEVPHRLVLEHDGAHRFPSAKRNPELYPRVKRMIDAHCLGN